MICAGDEISRTQGGNNNAYCQDNEISWMDWSLDDRRQALLEFAQRAVAFRRDHPSLHRRRFFQDRTIRGAESKDVMWLRPDGEEMTDEEWTSGWVRTLGMRLCGSHLGMVDEYGEKRIDRPILILLNAHHETIAFARSRVDVECVWELAFDTARPEWDTLSWKPGEAYRLEGRSLAAFVEAPIDDEDER
jgi:glycogen operon protein